MTIETQPIEDVFPNNCDFPAIAVFCFCFLFCNEKLLLFLFVSRFVTCILLFYVCYFFASLVL